MDTTTIVTLRDVVASNLTRLLNEAHIAVERVSAAAETFGLQWTPAWLRAVEHGQRALSGEQLLALPMVLSSVLTHRVSLSDLLVGKDPILFGQSPRHRQVTAAHLREVVTGSPHWRPFATVAPSALLMAANELAVLKMRTVREANLGDVDVRTLIHAEAGAGAAEALLARRLKVPEIVVIAAAASLWSRSLSDERDARIDAGGGSVAAVTRQLSLDVDRRISQAAPAALPGAA